MSTWNCLRDAGKLASTKINYIVGFYQRIPGLQSNTPQGTYVHTTMYIPIKSVQIIFLSFLYDSCTESSLIIVVDLRSFSSIY